MKKAKLKAKILYVLMAIIAFPAMLTAQSALMDIALIEPSVRANGMANAFTANNNDVFGMFYNPAQNYAETVVGATYQSGYMDDNTGVIGIRVQLPYDINVGGAFYYYSMGKLDMPGSTDGQKDLMGVLNFSKWIYGPVSLGVNLKYLNSALFGEFTADTFMFDAGALAEFKYFNIGLSYMNLGGTLQYDREKEDIPTALKAGLMAHNCADDLIYVSLGSDYVILNDENIFRIGAEADFDRLFLARAGYEKAGNGNGGFTLGAGFRYEKFEIDYAFTSYTDVNEYVHKFGLAYKIK